MKIPACFILVPFLGCALLVSAQDVPPPMPLLPPEQLDQLLSPIALYPDPLLGAILPASTHPGDLAAAANFARADVDPAEIQEQPWDDSVKALAHYPDVVQWMAQNPNWTDQVGAAVLEQQPDVLDAIQRLRANARNSGLLVDTPQEEVIVEDNYISILPASDVIYIPEYDPQYVLVPRGPREYLRFGFGFTAGAWLSYGLDWRDRSVWFDREHREAGPRFWRRDVASQIPPRELWRPPAVPPRERVNITIRQNWRISQPARFSERMSREHGAAPGHWTEPPRTPAYAPTGRTYAPEAQREPSNPAQSNPVYSRREPERGAPAAQPAPQVQAPAPTGRTYAPEVRREPSSPPESNRIYTHREPTRGAPEAQPARQARAPAFAPMGRRPEELRTEPRKASPPYEVAAPRRAPEIRTTQTPGLTPTGRTMNPEMQGSNRERPQLPASAPRQTRNVQHQESQRPSERPQKGRKRKDKDQQNDP